MDASEGFLVGQARRARSSPRGSDKKVRRNGCGAEQRRDLSGDSYAVNLSLRRKAVQKSQSSIWRDRCCKWNICRCAANEGNPWPPIRTAGSTDGEEPPPDPPHPAASRVAALSAPFMKSRRLQIRQCTLHLFFAASAVHESASRLGAGL